MRTFTISLIALVSFSTFSMTEAEMCEQYGRDLASNSEDQQMQFLNQFAAKTSAGEWRLSIEECNMHIQEGKNEYNFEIEAIFSDD
ncbi:hypothetical protein [Vibrio sp. WXL103]|uniref:hypothetical protein n=1 Tax=unclassified Vibrio TaxID=2614977 RepID=UPI003EC590DC